MKISELIYEDCLKRGEKGFCMHYDETEALRVVMSQREFDETRSHIIRRWGDVDVELVKGDHWANRITITDDQWKSDHSRYVTAMHEWIQWLNSKQQGKIE